MNDRTKIATQLLASVLIQDGVLCANGGKLWDDERCVNRAITLTDLLLAKLGESKPAKSAPSKINWRALSSMKPDRFSTCWVIEWDCVKNYVRNVWLAVWTGDGWEDVTRESELPIGGCDVEVYWQLHDGKFNAVGEACADFMRTVD